MVRLRKKEIRAFSEPEYYGLEISNPAFPEHPYKSVFTKYERDNGSPHRCCKFSLKYC